MGAPMTGKSAIEAIKGAVPWWAKIAAKLVLARLPTSGRTWQKLGLFSPGRMLDADYALGVFESHFREAGRMPEGFTYLELGPGDSLATAVIAWAHGASRGYLIDAGAYASRSMETYRPLIAKLKAMETGRNLAAFEGCETVEALLAATNCTYEEEGLESLKRVATESVDFIFSQATLEHVPLDEFARTCRELYRIQKPAGFASHRIDLKDHLGESLNSLRFSKELWEAPWFARKSGFYTNRLRLSQVVGHFREAGFTVEIRSTVRWESPPLPRGRLNGAFRELPDEELLTQGAVIGLRKNGE